MLTHRRSNVKRTSALNAFRRDAAAIRDVTADDDDDDDDDDRAASNAHSDAREYDDSSPHESLWIILTLNKLNYFFKKK